MKKINNYISEKLKISRNSIVDETFLLFGELYKGISEKDLKEIYDNYVIGWPFDDSVKGQFIATPFELLFMLAAMLVDDGFKPNYYVFLGYKSYKQLGGTHNPYDSSWYEDWMDEKRTTFDTVLDYLQHWIKYNYGEWIKIFRFCDKYKTILTTTNIGWWYTYEMDGEISDNAQNMGV